MINMLVKDHPHARTRHKRVRTKRVVVGGGFSNGSGKSLSALLFSSVSSVLAVIRAENKSAKQKDISITLLTSVWWLW